MSKNRFEMCFAGSGGQGVILASIIYAEAAILSGKHTMQSQSYGPEARGGASLAECIIGDSRLYFTKMGSPEFMLCLTDTAMDKYIGRLAPGGTLIIDAGMKMPERTDIRVYSLPILRTASEKVGKAMTANIVAVGAINSILGLFDDEILFEAVKAHIPAGTETLNLAAFEAGKELGAAAK